MNSPLRRLLVAGIFFAAFLSLPPVDRALAEPKIVDRIAAVVGSEIILLSEVNQRAEPALQELEKKASQGGGAMMNPRAQKKQIIMDTVQGMVDDTLVRQQAVEMKLKVTIEEVDMAISNMAKENGIDMATFEQAIKARGQDMITYRAEMRRNLLKYKVLNLRVRGRVNITENEARQYYNDQVRDVRETGEFEGAHILVKVPKGARAVDVAKLRKRAEALKIRVDNGEDFSSLAKESSQDESTKDDGGSFGRKDPGELAANIDRAFLDMEPGEVVGPVRTPEGYHVLKLLDREDLGIQSFSEVKTRIINQLMQEEMLRQQKIWLKELRLRTFIEVRL